MSNKAYGIALYVLLVLAAVGGVLLACLVHPRVGVAWVQACTAAMLVCRLFWKRR